MELKIEQIAFGCDTKSAWEKFAADAEAVDEVVFSGIYKTHVGIQTISKAVGYLAFDYKTGIEREYLHYPKMGNFHDTIRGTTEIYLSHFASHVPSIDYYLANEPEMASLVVMDVITNSHKNEKLIELGRKYRYVIIDTRMKYGYFTKLIQRIERNAATGTSSL